MSLDWSDFTSARSRIGLFATQKWNKTVTGRPGEIREFTARALTDAVPLSKSKFKQYYGAGTNGTGSASSARIGRHVLKAIITGDSNGAPLPFVQNPHSFLVDPCNLDTAPDLEHSIALVKMFPTFITNQDFVMNDDAPIGKEDIIKVSLTVGPDGSLNLEQGEILALVSSAENHLDLFNACESLKGKFNRNTVELLEVAAGFELPEEAFVGVAGTQSTDITGQGSYTLDDAVCSSVYDAFYLTHPLLTEANITSPYGMRNGKKHKGIDLRAKLKTNVYAAADGKIVGLKKQFSSAGGAGNYIKIQHVDGYLTKYFHLLQWESSLSTKEGQNEVKAGDLIGQSGNTGRTSKPYDPHLHFELWKGGTNMDPMLFIKTIQKCGVSTPPAIAATDPLTTDSATDHPELPTNAGEG